MFLSFSLGSLTFIQTWTILEVQSSWWQYPVSLILWFLRYIDTFEDAVFFLKFQCHTLIIIYYLLSPMCFPNECTLSTFLTIVSLCLYLNRCNHFLSGTYLEIALLSFPYWVRFPAFWNNGHVRFFSFTPFHQCEICTWCHSILLSQPNWYF